MCSQAYPPFNVLCIGAGSIGTYIGGSLALHGSPVVFLEQPAAAERLRLRGLLLQLDDREHYISNP
jgi:2-dehydropantoate 2-reductase